MWSCSYCGAALAKSSASLPYCVNCLIEGNKEVLDSLHQIHQATPAEEELSSAIPETGSQVNCRICSRECLLARDEKGYCGLRVNRGGKLDHLAGVPSRGVLEYYFDPLPTNCVAAWVCPAKEEAPPGAKNLAVFYGACTLNCLFCQNWHYRTLTHKISPVVSAQTLAQKVNPDTSCICFFGGDPAPQLPHALATASIAIKNYPHLKICWETSGNIPPKLFSRVMEISYCTGGTVKFDFKAYHPNLYFALTGGSNRPMLNNFAVAAEFSREKRINLAVASTLLVPGYITVPEIYAIASFIAAYNPYTPYSLLGFHPQYRMRDLPPTSRKEADSCLFAAQEAGLYNVHLANRHLLI